MGAALREDLAALGVETPSQAADHKAAGTIHPLGVAYALEGSSMGARFLLKQVLGASTEEDPRPTAYLRGAAAGAAERWPALCASLEAHGLGADAGADSAGEQQQILDSASAVFASLIDFMDQGHTGASNGRRFP